MNRMSILEIRRQILHIAFGLGLLTLLYFNIIDVFIMGLGLLVAFLLSILVAKYDIPFVSWVMDKFERPEWRHKLPGKGPLMFLLGSFIVVLLFPAYIAYTSILILTLGDAISHIYGKLFCKKKPKYLKSIEGIFFGFLVSFLASLFFVSLLQGFFGCLIAMFIEGLERKTKSDFFDDNLLIPIIASIVMALLA